MQISDHLAQFLWFGRHLSRQLYATRCRSVLQHLHEHSTIFRRQLAQRFLRGLRVLVWGYSVGHFTVAFQNLLIGVALGRLSLLVSINKIAVLFMALSPAEYVLKNSHVQHSLSIVPHTDNFLI